MIFLKWELKKNQWPLSISRFMSFWSSKKLSTNCIKTLLFFILSFWIPIKWILKCMNRSSVSLNFPFTHSVFFICAAFWGFSLHDFFCSQIYTPPVSSLLLYPFLGGFCLTFDCHISLFKFPNRIFQNYLFSLHGNASPLPSDGVNMCISWYFPDCYVNSFLGVGSLLPLLHGLCLLYIFGNSWLSSHVWEGCVQALGCDGSWSGHWPCTGSVTFRWQCGTWGGGRSDAVPENFRALKWCYEFINLYLYLMGLVLRGVSKILQRRIPVSRWKTEDRLRSLPSI